MRKRLPVVALLVLVVLGCAPATDDRKGSIFNPPQEIIDLGALVTEDLPYRSWGKRQMDAFGFDRPNAFEDVELLDPTYVANSYYTLFNHGGAHLDAPNHTDPDAAGIDGYELDDFIGPARVIDVSDLPKGSAVPLSRVADVGIEPGEILLVYTAYVPPRPGDLPVYIALSREASEHLAALPVGAIGIDSLSIDNLAEFGRLAEGGVKGYENLLPAHHAFLAHDIPVYEQLMNLDRAVGLSGLYFVGVPLNIAGGNGVPVRPVLFVYD